MRETTIVLADDHQILRQGLRAMLEAEPGFSVVGEADDGVEAVRLVDRLRPRVLVLDLSMPALGGLEVVRQVRRRQPRTQVVILSMHANEAYVAEALQNGAAAYVLKQSTAGELVKAIRHVVDGQRYLSPPLSNRAIETYLQKAKDTPSDRYESLTSREREVLQLAAEGYSNAEIGRRLFISPRTVEVHRSNMMRKLDLRSQSGLIRYALSRGLVSLEPGPPNPSRKASEK